MKTDGINLKRRVNYSRRGYHSRNRHSLVMRKNTLGASLLQTRYGCSPQIATWKITFVTPKKVLSRGPAHDAFTSFVCDWKRIWRSHTMGKKKRKKCHHSIFSHFCSRYIFPIHAEEPLQSPVSVLFQSIRWTQATKVFFAILSIYIYCIFSFHRQGNVMNRKHSLSWVLLIIHRVWECRGVFSV